MKYLYYTLMSQRTRSLDEPEKDTATRSWATSWSVDYEVDKTCSMHKRFWPENLKGREHVEDLGVDGQILKCMLKKQVDWIHLQGTETSGGLWWTRQMNFEFLKGGGISWKTKSLSVSQKLFCLLRRTVQRIRRLQWYWRQIIIYFWDCLRRVL